MEIKMSEIKKNNKTEDGLHIESMSVEECERALGELEAELLAFASSNPVETAEEEIKLETSSVTAPEKDLRSLDGEKAPDGDCAEFAFKITSLPEESAQEETSLDEDTASAVTCFDDNELFIAAARIVVEEGVVSTSFLQRRLLIGYGRAVEIVNRLEELAIVSPVDGNRARRVMVSPEKLEKILSRL